MDASTSFNNGAKAPKSFNKFPPGRLDVGPVVKTGRNLLIVIALLITSCSAAYASYPHHATRFYQMRDGYIYLALKSNYFKKIEKETGRVVWTSDRAWRSGGGKYTQPVFHDGRFLVIEMESSELISVDCETGAPKLAYQYNFGCSTAEAVYDPIVYGDLLIAFSSSDIQAVSLAGGGLVWEFTCKDRDLLSVNGYIQSGDSLFVLSSSFADENLRRKDESPLEDYERARVLEMIELDCSTGEELNRFGKELFFGDAKGEVGTAWSIGEWNGKWLIVVGRRFGSGALSYSLFGFDPVARSAVMLVEQLAFPPYSGKPDVFQGYDFEPVISDALIFYWLSVQGEEPMLVAKSLTNGETIWSAGQKVKPIAATGDKLFTLRYGRWRHYEIFCRDARSGDLVWSRKFRRLHRYAWPTGAMASDGHLYFMSTGFLRELDVKTGDIVWQVELEQWGSPDYQDDGILNKLFNFLSEIF